MNEVVDDGWNDATEDWPKKSWDFHRDDGSPVASLTELSQILGRPAADVAYDLTHLPFGKAAPPELIQEALNAQPR